MEVGQQKWIDKAQAQTEKLTELVNSLVTLSRMDEEESPLKMAPFPISDAVTETAESFREHALSQGHGLTLAIQPGLTYLPLASMTAVASSLPSAMTSFPPEIPMLPL